MSTPECERTVELLPWFARGTLDPAERAEVAGHLASCASCREELEATRRALWITGRHLPVGLLADYASGLGLGDWPRDVVEEHLASCASCREDLAPDAAAPARAAPRRGAGAGWRPLALAASLIAAAGLGWLGGRLGPERGDSRPGPPIARVGLVELEPESLRTRAAEGEPPLLDPATPVTLVLHSDLVVDAADFRLRVVSAAGEALGEAHGLTPRTAGGFAVQLDPRGWPAGEIRLELEAAGPGGWQPFERYRLRLGP